MRTSRRAVRRRQRASWHAAATCHGLLGVAGGRRNAGQGLRRGLRAGPLPAQALDLRAQLAELLEHPVSRLRRLLRGLPVVADEGAGQHRGSGASRTTKGARAAVTITHRVRRSQSAMRVLELRMSRSAVVTMRRG